MSDKTPQPGEFWEKENVRLRVVGSKRNGITVGENECGSIDLFHPHHDWRHLADCTGFDWQPETFPQYWTSLDGSTKPVAYLRRSSTDTFYHVYADGTEHGPYVWITEEAKHRKQITKEEADSRIEKPQPAESPDDWVVQDRVPARSGIDEGWFEYDYYRAKVKKQFWSISAQPEHAGRRHGDRVDLSGDMATFELRCRRKDLPLHPKFATLANEIEQFRADMMRRCDELGVKLTKLEEGGK
jgi:hypothetical protein